MMTLSELSQLVQYLEQKHGGDTPVLAHDTEFDALLPVDALHVANTLHLDNMYVSPTEYAHPAALANFTPAKAVIIGVEPDSPLAGAEVLETHRSLLTPRS